jgi:hypothetical protein
MDDELPYHDAAVDRALKEPRGGEVRDKTTLGLRDKVKKKPAIAPSTPPSSSAAAVTPSTPSLKIRLPAHRPLHTSPTHAGS